MKKTYIKKNLISFVIGLILFGSLGVYAIVTFQSKNVSYKNVASGLASDNVQGAIDELYKECTKTPAPGDIILENENIITTGDGLYKDEYEEGRYFYKGKNVNNYITFNNEIWRIVSVEPDKTIKIMKEASIGDIAWDSSNSNNWARPATLNTYLNKSYLTGTLNAIAQGQIVAKNWNIGVTNYAESNMSTQINKEKATTWNGKVALITVSEYIRSNSNQSNCETFLLYTNNYSSCKNTTWMYINDNWWTLSPGPGYTYYMFYIYSDGGVNYGGYGANSADFAVRPSVYLSSEVKITGGDGSQNNPYTLG